MPDDLPIETSADTATDADWFDPDTTTFGDRLTGAREAAGLDVETLASRLGVRPKTIRAWEDDRAEPRANRVSMLAGLTNVSLVWLMTGAGAGPRAEPSGGSGLGTGALLAELDALGRDAAGLNARIADLAGRLRARPEASE